MKSEAIWPKILGAFVVTVILYLAGFYGLEYRRHVHGPWVVEFRRENGAPALTINQTTIGITNVSIIFPGVTLTNLNLPQTVAFDAPEKPIPFGESPFADLTFLPGTVTFKLAGHTVELIPRVLAIDSKTQPWVANSVVTVK